MKCHWLLYLPPYVIGCCVPAALPSCLRSAQVCSVGLVAHCPCCLLLRIFPQIPQFPFLKLFAFPFSFSSPGHSGWVPVLPLASVHGTVLCSWPAHSCLCPLPDHSSLFQIIPAIGYGLRLILSPAPLGGSWPLPPVGYVGICPHPLLLVLWLAFSPYVTAFLFWAV